MADPYKHKQAGRCCFICLDLCHLAAKYTDLTNYIGVYLKDKSLSYKTNAHCHLILKQICLDENLTLHRLS